MASRYWVGGTAAWDGTAGSKWATTSGGAGGAAVPTSSDDVFFDANSGVAIVTVQTAVGVGGSLNCTGFTGTLIQSTNLNIGSATAGDFILSSGMTFTWTAGAIKLTSTKVSSTTIDLAGKTVGNFTINGNGASFVLANDINATLACAFSGGSVDLNGFNVTCGNLSNGNTLTRSVNLRGGTITLTGTGAIFDAPAGVLTFIWSTGAKIIISNTTVTAKTFAGGTNATIPPVQIAGAALAGTVTFSGAFTCGGFIFDADSNVVFTISTTYTATSLASNGTSGHPAVIKSTSAGTAFTIAVSAGASISYVSLKDSTASGGTFKAYNSTNVSGNTNWNFATVGSLTKGLVYSVFIPPTSIALTKSLKYTVKGSVSKTLGLKYCVRTTHQVAPLGFSPAQITGLRAWFDASQIAGLADGDPVNTWADASGGGNDATKGVFSAPTLKLNQLNGRAVVRFVAASAQALRARYTQVGGGGAPWTMMVVARQTGGADERVVGAIYPDTSNWLLGWHTSFGEGEGYYNGGFVGAGGAVTNTFRQFTGKGDGATGYFYAEGTLTGSASPHENPNGSIAFSGYDGSGGTSELSNCEIAEVILYDGALSDADRGLVETYLNEKYFGTLPPTTYSLKYVVRSIHAITKSLKYTVKGAASALTKSLKYTIRRTPSAITKSLKYTVHVVPSALTKSLVYRVKTSTSKTQSLRYAVRRSISVTLGLKYEVITHPPALTKSLGYRVRTQTAKTQSLKYAVRVSHALTKSLTYDVRSPHAAITRSLKYAVRLTPAAKTLSLRYEVVKAQALTRSLAYKVRASHAKTLSLTYGIIAVIALQKSLKYVVRGQQARTLSLTYTVLKNPYHIAPSLYTPVTGNFTRTNGYTRAASKFRRVRSYTPF